MIEEKSIKEFQDSGLLLFINQFLHIFGWAIVCVKDDDGNYLRMFPARCKYRGFTGEMVDENYQKLTEYMHNNSEELLEDLKLEE